MTLVALLQAMGWHSTVSSRVLEREIEELLARWRKPVEQPSQQRARAVPEIRSAVPLTPLPASPLPEPPRPEPRPAKPKAEPEAEGEPPHLHPHTIKPEVRVLPSRLTPLSSLPPKEPPWLKDTEPLPLPNPASAVPLYAKRVEPLFPPLITRAILTRLAEVPVSAGEVDVPRLVKLLAEGRLLTVIPRRTVRTLTKGLELLLDVGNGMEPFANDVANIVDDLRRSVGRDRLRVQLFSTCPVYGVFSPKTSAIQPYQTPTGGAPVLAVTDLGISNRRSRATLEGDWLHFASRLRTHGNRLLVLVPGSSTRVPITLRQALAPIPWDRRTSARLTVPSRAAVPASEGALLLGRLASIAGRIDPQFVRALRLGLAADLGTEAEADLWFSNLAESAAITGIVLRPEKQRQLQDQLAAEGEDLLTRAWEILFRLRTGRPWAEQEAVPDRSWLLVQEELTYWALKGLDDKGLTREPTRAKAEARLKQILKTLITASSGRERDAVAWTKAAQLRLPPAVLALEPAHHLLLGAALRGADTLPSLAVVESAIDSRTAYLVPRDESASMSVWLRLIDGGLEAALDPMPRAHRITALPLRPLPVIVEWIEAGAPQRGTLELNPPPRAFVALKAAWVDIIMPSAGPFRLSLDRAPPPFRDGDEPWCPEMMALPKGQFLMGSAGEPYEEPQHQVTIDYPFAISRYAVTFAEYDHFCEVMKYRKPSDGGWGRGRRPVINVSWNDAKTYVEWLSYETGRQYRLPSEAEWEYACRASTSTCYSFGDKISMNDANYGSYIGRTTAVGEYLPNSWGIYDMHGNVWEWTEDFWHINYVGASAKGGAWTEEEAGESSRVRVLRGGSWFSYPEHCRSSMRTLYRLDMSNASMGFRIAR